MVLVAAAAVVLVVAGALAVPHAVDRASGPIPATSPTGTDPSPVDTDSSPTGTDPSPTRTASSPVDTPEPGSGPPPAEPLPAMPAVSGLRLTEAARTGAYQLTSYALRGGGTAVRVPGSLTFRTLPWTSVSVSPIGRIAVVDTTDATPGSRVGIIESLAAGTIRWLAVGNRVRNPAWSPDGRKVVVTEFGEQDVRLGFDVLDPGSWKIQQGGFAEPDPADFGTFGSHVGSHPSGDVIVGAVELPDDFSGTPEFALRTWTLSGEERGTVPTPGALSASGSQLLSPSGSRAAVRAGDRDITIVDTRSGRSQTTLRLPGQTVYGWVDEGHLVVERGGAIELLALDGTTRPYATRTGDAALPGRSDITHVGA